MTSTRGKARKRALDVLFEAELRQETPLAALERIRRQDPQLRPFTAELVEGVAEHSEQIDARISAVLSEGWSLDRMPRVDRCAARIAVFEIDHTDLPVGVAISEAVALASDLSTDDSPAFLSGVLGAVAGGKVASGADDIVAPHTNL